MKRVVQNLAALILFSFIFVQNCNLVCAIVESRMAKNKPTLSPSCCESSQESPKNHCAASQSNDKDSHSCNCELLKEYPGIVSGSQLFVQSPQFSYSNFFLPLESTDQFRFYDSAALIVGYDPPQQYQQTILSSSSSRAPPSLPSF